MASKQFLEKVNWIQMTLESLLIVFSVLLALFLNEAMGSAKEERLKKTAINKVAQELNANRLIVEDWIKYHNQVLENFDQYLKERKTDNLDESWRTLLPKGIIQSLIDNTAFEALKTSNVIALIDYETMYEVSKIYKLQAVGVEKTIDRIISLLNSKDAMEDNKQAILLKQLRNSFRELVSQEYFLIQSYMDTLNKLGVK